MQLNGKQSTLQKVVFEVRYQYGFAYLDKCGRIINAIMREYPEWMIRSNPEATSASLASIRTGCTLNFSSQTIQLSIDHVAGGPALSEEDTASFTDQIEYMTALLIDQLGVKDFNRMGFRAWYLFDCKDELEARTWINSLGYFSISADLEQAFGGKIENTAAIIFIGGKDRQFRVEVSPVERSVQIDLGQEILAVRASALPKDQRATLLKQIDVKKRIIANPAFAVQIDVDVFQEFPLTINPRDFVETSLLRIEKGLESSST